MTIIMNKAFNWSLMVVSRLSVVKLSIWKCQCDSVKVHNVVVVFVILC